MASKHVLKLSSINEFFGNDNKMIRKGENAMESNHVKRMQFDADLMIVRGEIHASMKEKTYSVEINLNKLGDILSGSCTCPRGIKCHHIATLALFGHYNISITDKQSTWNVPKPTDRNESVKTAEEMYPPHKSYSAINTTMTTEEKNALKEKLSTFGNTVGFTWLLQEEKGEIIPSNFPIIEDIINSNEFRNAADKADFIKHKCAIDDETLKQIAESTTGQALNENWYLVRKFRLTASNFGAILAACNRDRYPETLFKTLIGAYSLDGIKSIQWGKIHEKDAIEYLKTTYNMDIQQTGIWLTNSGASPDGLVREDTIIEIKCPYSYRNDLLSQKLKSVRNYIIFYNDIGEICINPNHNYYHQIQGNLYILKKSKCYLCIWTPKEVLTVLVERDPSWDENILKLENFYINHYLPKLLEI